MFCTILRLAVQCRDFQIRIMCKVISRLQKFQDCVEHTYLSGGSRNFERVVRLAHTLSQRTAEGGAQSREAAISPREARKKFFYVFFLAIRKRSRSISAHSGHVSRRKED